jgi:hypothetical protein
MHVPNEFFAAIANPLVGSDGLYRWPDEKGDGGAAGARQSSRQCDIRTMTNWAPN